MDIGQKNFIERSKCIKNEVILPRDEECRAGRLKKEKEPFSIRWKEFWPLMFDDAEKVPQFMAEKVKFLFKLKNLRVYKL